MSNLSRRSFLKRAAATAGAGAVFTIAGTKSSGSILGANETVRIGVAGINGRGQSHMSEFSRMPGEGHLPDRPDTSLHGSRAKKIKSWEHARLRRTSAGPGRQNLDAISIASCRHWHRDDDLGLQAARTSTSKPMSHIFEGGSASGGREVSGIVQHGTQGRSSSGWRRRPRVASSKYGSSASQGYASKSAGDQLQEGQSAGDARPTSGSAGDGLQPELRPL